MVTVSEAPIQTRAGAATDTGTRRQHNEDSYLCEAPLFLVADGMGGYEAGEVASAAIVDTFRSLAGRPYVDLEVMRETYDAAGERVSNLADAGGSAGSTLSGCAIAHHEGSAYWLVINVGDSRTYRFAHGTLEQISVDHSVVQELVDAGELTESEASSDSRRNVVTRAIGAGTVSAPDFWMIPAESGDRMLVCSDGLTGEVGDAKIATILGDHSDPQQAALALVHEAIVKGGRDNITVIVVDVTGVSADDQIDADTVPRVGTAST